MRPAPAQAGPERAAPAAERPAPASVRPTPQRASAPPVEETPWWRSRRFVIGASAAIVGLGLVAGFQTYRGVSARELRQAHPPEVVEHLDVSELATLPEPLASGARAIMGGRLQLPAWRQAMDRGSGGDLEYPVQEAIEELQPTLRWSPFGSFYNVAVIDPEHHVVARVEIRDDSHWTVPVELKRGAVYTWEVSTQGQVRRNSFRVLDDTEAGLVAGVRAGHGQSHMAMGMASLELGMLSQAQREFQALVEAHPHSPEAAQLLRTVSGLTSH